MSKKKVVLSHNVPPPAAIAVDRIDSFKVAVKEAKDFLDGPRYEHAVDLVKRLRDFGDSQQCADLDISPIRGFYELSDKGGVLGKINLRIYFSFFATWRTIVVLGAWKKEAERKTPGYIIDRMENRMDWYLRLRTNGQV